MCVHCLLCIIDSGSKWRSLVQDCVSTRSSEFWFRERRKDQAEPWFGVRVLSSETGSAGLTFGERTRPNPGSEYREKTGQTLVQQVLGSKNGMGTTLVWQVRSSEKRRAKPWFGRLRVRRKEQAEPRFCRFGVRRKTE